MLAFPAAPAPALVAGKLYRFVLGLDRSPRVLDADEHAALQDPFARLLADGPFPTTLEELLGRLDAQGAAGAVPHQKWYLLGDGGQIPVSVAPNLERNLRLVVTRSRVAGGSPDLMVSTSTAITDSSTFLQVIGWDAQQEVFNYYERRGGAWVWAGDSWHSLADETRGQGPFDSHVNGSVVMKELTVPWSHWHSQSASISSAAFAAGDPFLHSALAATPRSGAEVFEREVARPGVARWTAARLRRVVQSGRVTRLPQLLRQLLRTETVNLVSSGKQSDRAASSDSLELPREFFFDVDAFVGSLGLELGDLNLAVAGPAYAAARAKLGLQLRDERSNFQIAGETFFAFLVPGRALEDSAVLDAMLEQEILSPRLAAALLLVDFCQPIFSDRRARLLHYVPAEIAVGASGAALDEALPEAIRAGAHDADGPELEFVHIWDELSIEGWQSVVSARLNGFLVALRDKLRTGEGVEALLRLAQGRRHRFRQLHLAEFALTLPRSPLDETYAQLRMHEDGSIA